MNQIKDKCGETLRHYADNGTVVVSRAKRVKAQINIFAHFLEEISMSAASGTPSKFNTAVIELQDLLYPDGGMGGSLLGGDPRRVVSAAGQACTVAVLGADGVTADVLARIGSEKGRLGRHLEGDGRVAVANAFALVLAGLDVRNPVHLAFLESTLGAGRVMGAFLDSDAKQAVARAGDINALLERLAAVGAPEQENVIVAIVGKGGYDLETLLDRSDVHTIKRILDGCDASTPRGRDVLRGVLAGGDVVFRLVRHGRLANVPIAGELVSAIGVWAKSGDTGQVCLVGDVLGFPEALPMLAAQPKRAGRLMELLELMLDASRKSDDANPYLEAITKALGAGGALRAFAAAGMGPRVGRFLASFDLSRPPERDAVVSIVNPKQHLESCQPGDFLPGSGFVGRTRARVLNYIGRGPLQTIKRCAMDARAARRGAGGARSAACTF